MRTHRAFLAGLAALAAASAAPAAAQSWESPTLFSPGAHDDIGLYAIKFEGTDDLGFHAIWRQSGNINLGVRAGIGPGEVDWLVGAEFYGPLRILGPDSPVLVSWIVGAGAMFLNDRFDNSVTALRIPAGVSLGLNTGSSSVSIVPYVHPRVAFDLIAVSDGDEEDTDSEFNVDLDIGADVTLGDRFVLRAGFTLSESNTFGAGVAYRIPRRVVVR
jgi:hypothetical protein